MKHRRTQPATAGDMHLTSKAAAGKINQCCFVIKLSWIRDEYSGTQEHWDLVSSLAGRFSFAGASL
ncbi:hypothetical protein XH88_25870 [Bradyrhizobium sp. CCBAU 51627]|nr:hypothetical protein [Bradyrhizobium sp. CCBAU 51627]